MKKIAFTLACILLAAAVALTDVETLNSAPTNPNDAVVVTAVSIKKPKGEGLMGFSVPAQAD